MAILNHEFNGLVRYFGSLVKHTYTGAQYVSFDQKFRTEI